MSIAVKFEGNTARFALTGELTIYTAAELKTELADVMARADSIEIDLSGITEVDTAGLQWMLIAKRNPGKEVRFVKHPPSVVRLVDLANLGGVLGDPLILAARDPGGNKP